MNCFRLLLLPSILTAFAGGPLPYAPAPNDTYWIQQWYLDNVDSAGVRHGVDMNARTAWALSKGRGITIAIVDDGVDLTHPDLVHQTRPDLHWNFEKDTNNGEHPSDAKMHGTAVAGLAVAEGGNGLGISGMAPEARFASWVIYNTNTANGTFVSSNQLAKMFNFHTDEVQIQNHSWVKPGLGLGTDGPIAMSAVEDAAIGEAVSNGRQGLGTIIIRAAGNSRIDGRNVNDDGYTSDPRAITVAAVNAEGFASSYSTPGAAILVSAIGGEPDNTLFTTDRVGLKGFNQITFPTEPALSDYVFKGLGFSGTSAAAPLVSGAVALMLSVNPELTYRDVQQILLLSAAQTNPNDPDIQQNAAGLFVSHNTGFGMLNSGTAVDLARTWKTRPAATTVQATVEQESAIPDGALTLAVQPLNGDPTFRVTALPSLGIHVNQNSPIVPLVYIGEGAATVTNNLSGKAALIKRGGAQFATKIQNAADAGAIFAVMFNNDNSDDLIVMGNTDYVPIPAIFISQKDGESLTNIIAAAGVNAQIQFVSTNYSFSLPDALLCEQVKVTIEATHPQRGDMRITLRSPSGTVSVLQRLGPDLDAYPGKWTFMTTHHFFENSQGIWNLFLSDEAVGGTGTVERATLEIAGVPIKDEDHDGLDDDWEAAQFGSFSARATDDPDLDGYSNAREQILGTDPTHNDSPLMLQVAVSSDSSVRLNWPSRTGVTYEVLGANAITEPFSVLDEGPGGFPRSAWYAPRGSVFQFYRVREKQ